MPLVDENDISRAISVFRREVDRHFAFLVHECGFLGPTFYRMGPELPHFPVVWVTFTGRTLQVELLLDWRDDDVSCRVRTLPPGHRGPFDPRDMRTLTRKQYAGQLVLARGKTPHVPNLRGLTLEDAISPWLEAQARTLRDFLPEVLADVRGPA